MVRPSTATLTPSAMATGLFPIRDMILTLPFVLLAMEAIGALELLTNCVLAATTLPDLAQHFAADVPLPGFAVTDHAATGAQNGDALAIQHGPQFLGAAKHSPTR